MKISRGQIALSLSLVPHSSQLIFVATLLREESLTPLFVFLLFLYLLLSLRYLFMTTALGPFAPLSGSRRPSATRVHARGSEGVTSDRQWSRSRERSRLPIRYHQRSTEPQRSAQHYQSSVINLERNCRSLRATHLAERHARGSGESKGLKHCEPRMKRKRAQRIRTAKQTTIIII